MFGFRMRTLGALSLSAVAMLAIAAAPASAAAPRTLMVDGDGHAANGNCNASTSAYSTIQSAISAAHHGDTVKVCPGDYTENLVIRAAKDDVSIVSTKAWEARIWRPTSLSSETPLVEIRAGADGVLFKHFALIFPTTNDCDGPTNAAILVSGTNASIRGNRIRTDGVDDQFYSCGYVFGVVIAPNNEINTALSAPARPSGESIPVSALVGWNTIRNFQVFGITAVGDATVATVKRNSIHFGHQGAVDCTSPFTATSLHSSSVVPSGPGPLVCFALGVIYADGAEGEIRGNVIVSDFVLTSTAGPTPQAPLMEIGIAVGLLGAAGDVNVVENRLGFVALGIGVDADGAVNIEKNEVGFTLGYGIGIEDGTGAKVKQNEIFESGGLDAGSSTSGNVFRNNTVTDGGCNDDSIGTDTGGTANHWANNTADSSDPLGICAINP